MNSKFIYDNKMDEYCILIGVEQNIIDFINILDVLVLPSIKDEDFPNVVIESMALSKPVIATKIAGVPEQVVNGSTGILVEPKDIDDLSHAIIEMHRNNKLREEMGIESLKRFDAKFTSEKSIKKYIEIYNNRIN